MNGVTTLPWGAWVVLAAVPIGIIILYFLKLRRQPIEVPSTYLWKRAIEDLHVNSLLQRLRAHLLLFLQLLFVTLALIALGRPLWETRGGPAKRLIFLLDTSASMAARDGAGGGSRLDQAKAEIKQRIDALRGQDVGMLIAFSDRADVLQEFTSDKNRLLAALEGVSPTARTTNIAEALRAAAGLANPNRASTAGDVKDVQVADPLPADLEIYSDGGFAGVSQFDLGNLTPTYHAVGSSDAENVAVTAMSAERSPASNDQVETFVRIANFGTQQRAGRGVLYVDDQLVDAQAVELEAEQELALSFSTSALEGSQLRFELEIPDIQPLDNRAFATLGAQRVRSVLVVTPGNNSLLLAMETEEAKKVARLDFRTPDYLQGDEYRRRAVAGSDDLIIFDRCAPETMPPCNTFFIAALPPQQWRAGELQSPLIPIDIDRTHPLMRFLDLFSLQIVQGRVLEAPPGKTTLIDGATGPLLVLAPREGFEDLVMGFAIVSQEETGDLGLNTDWPLQRSWPVFVFNLLRHLGGSAEESFVPGVLPGETAILRLDYRGEKMEVIRPDGVSVPLDVRGSTATPFTDTELTGVYRVETAAGRKPVSFFSVNLLDPQESRLRVPAEIELGYEEVAQSSATSENQHPVWRWVLLAALGVLGVEWIVFNRRIA